VLSSLSKISFRDATESDLPVLVQIGNACFPEAYYDKFKFDEAAFRHYMEAPLARVILAEDESGQPVGSAIIRLPESDKSTAASSNLNAHLCTLAVTVRGQGFGRLLLMHVEAIARDHGAATITLNVHEASNVAIRLYQSSGYNFVMKNKALVYGDRSVALKFQKLLPPPSPLAAPVRPVAPTNASDTDATAKNFILTRA
jgi:ribosomal protein S18 acetylase RimI-like enzyme